MMELAPIVVDVGTLLNGRYEVVRRVGSGGMGLVFEVRDTALNNERVALKLLSPNRDDDISDDELLTRFRNEVLITRRLAHPNIVRTFDFGQLPDGRFFMTMEYVDGATVEELIKSEFFLRSSIHYVSLVLTKICDAIHEAHKLGVMHRDLKAANVLISHGGEVKVTDFGLARMRGNERRVTTTGECVGTPVYMSPEQVQGLPCDHRVDIYAIGIIGYEMVTGRVPFTDESWYGLANKIVHQDIPALATGEARIPLWFEEFVNRASAKSPDDRFATADEAATALRTHLFQLEEERAEKARPQNAAHVFQEWDSDLQMQFEGRDRRFLHLALGFLCVLLVSFIGIAGLAFYFRQPAFLFAEDNGRPPDDFFRPMTLAPPQSMSTPPPDVSRIPPSAQNRTIQIIRPPIPPPIAANRPPR